MKKKLHKLKEIYNLSGVVQYQYKAHFSEVEAMRIKERNTTKRFNNLFQLIICITGIAYDKPDKIFIFLNK